MSTLKMLLVRVPILLLVLAFLSANAQESASVVSLGIPAVSSATQATNNTVCGFGLVRNEQLRPVGMRIQVTNLDTSEVATVTDDHALWNQGLEVLTDIACPAGKIYFTTTSRGAETKSLWVISNGSAPEAILRPDDNFGGSTYLAGVRLIGNSFRSVIIGQFSVSGDTRTLAFSMDGKLIADFGHAELTVCFKLQGFKDLYCNK